MVRNYKVKNRYFKSVRFDEEVARQLIHGCMAGYSSGEMHLITGKPHAEILRRYRQIRKNSLEYIGDNLWGLLSPFHLYWMNAALKRAESDTPDEYLSSQLSFHAGMIAGEHPYELLDGSISTSVWSTEIIRNHPKLLKNSNASLEIHDGYAQLLILNDMKIFIRSLSSPSLEDTTAYINMKGFYKCIYGCAADPNSPRKFVRNFGRTSLLKDGINDLNLNSIRDYPQSKQSAREIKNYYRKQEQRHAIVGIRTSCNKCPGYWMKYLSQIAWESMFSYLSIDKHEEYDRDFYYAFVMAYAFYCVRGHLIRSRNRLIEVVKKDVSKEIDPSHEAFSGYVQRMYEKNWGTWSKIEPYNKAFHDALENNPVQGS